MDLPADRRPGGDTLNGGSGDDILLGGDDADTFVFKGAFGTDVIRDFDRLQVGEVNDLLADDFLF